MRTAQDIILKPIITEESMMGIMTKGSHTGASRQCPCP